MSSNFYTVNGHQMHVEVRGDSSLPTVVFLHGFTGSTSTWHNVLSILENQIHAVSIDLWGHGRSDSPKNITHYSMEQQVNDIEDVCQQLELKTFILIGYSMGGRIALGYAVSYPTRVKALVLESASPGLKIESDRLERQERDAKLAKRLQEESLSDFVDFWENIALFESQKSLSKEKRAAVRKERLNQNSIGLANSLLGIGTGSQPSFWNVITDVQKPVLLLTGELDEKFETIANVMKKSLPIAEHQTILQTGHALHVEKPEEFATIVKDYVKQIYN